MESRNAKFLENHLTSGSDQIKNSISMHDHIEYEPSTSSNRLVTIYNIPQVQMDVDQPIIETPQATDDPVNQVGHQDDEQLVEQQDPQENVDQTLRRSTRIRKSSIPNDYIVYLQEYDYNVGAENDPESFRQAMSCKESNLWYDAMNDEMNSMKKMTYGII